MARATNAIVAQNGRKELDTPKFSVAIRGDAMQDLIRKSVRDEDSAKRLTGTLISVVSSSEQLQQCNPATIVAAALRGEGMGLTIGMGYYVVPFGNTAAFILGYKGEIQLALAGGDVADMDVVEVREGEYIGRNRKTKRPEFDFSIYKTDEEAEKHPIIGYYAYVEKKDGYFRGEYMSLNAILDHADTYSKSFSKADYLKMVSGEMTADGIKSLKSKSPYYSEPETMFKKTVMRRLLNSGYVILAASTNLKRALEVDDAAEAEMDAIASFDVVDVDSSTGEIRSESVQSAPEAPEIVNADGNTEKTEKPKKATQKPVDAEYTEIVDGAEANALSGFFDD